MKKLLSITVLIIVLAAIGFTAGAQPSGENIPLSTNQPTSIQILAGETFTLDFTLDLPAEITLQAISGTAQPMLTIAQGSTIVALTENAGGEFSITLEAALSAGTYTVEVGGANNTSGLVIVSVQRFITAQAAVISPGAFISGTLDDAQPFALFTFADLREQAYIYVDSGLDDFGVDVRITRTGEEPIEVASSTSDTLGVRFRLPVSLTAYELQISTDGSRDSVPFTACIIYVSQPDDICSGDTPQTTTVDPFIFTPAAPAACTVTPNASGGVNIRQSATTNAVIIGALPSNQSADVQGVSPDGFFFNILFNNLNGWVARSVVTTNGACDNLSTITPPPVQAIPTATPPPTHTPAPTAAPSGPCLITINSPTYVYTTTTAQVDYLQDQIQVGELIPTGRTANNSWWKTNYYSAWIQTSTFGNTATVSGNCSGLPIVNP